MIINMNNIEYIGYGLGYRLPDGTIQINRALKKYPKLHDEVLRHELGHKEVGLSLYNVVHDLKPCSRGMEFFVLTHPSTWIALSPIRINKGQLMYDPVTLVKYLSWIIQIYIVYKVLKWIF